MNTLLENLEKNYSPEFKDFLLEGYMLDAALIDIMFNKTITEDLRKMRCVAVRQAFSYVKRIEIRHEMGVRFW